MNIDSDCRYRIGDVIFDTSEEAEAWVEAGNIGGTYSIVSQVWCEKHDGWYDETYDHTNNVYICSVCYQAQREASAAAYRAQQAIDSQRNTELARLAKWNSGAPITPYVERVYLHEDPTL